MIKRIGNIKRKNSAVHGLEACGERLRFRCNPEPAELSVREEHIVTIRVHARRADVN